MLEGVNVVVLDLETARSADDCLHCNEPPSEHGHHTSAHPGYCPSGFQQGRRLEIYEPIGWDRKAMLGLSIGCYYDYKDSQLHWFDLQTLEQTVRLFVDRQPLLVSFNGIQFDFALMRALLRGEAETLAEQSFVRAVDEAARVNRVEQLTTLCDTFKTLCATSYDLLQAMWAVDPARKFERGLNSLDAICRAEGLAPKEMDGATAPRLWASGRYAEVITYNVGDVLRTRALFEKVIRTGEIRRGDGQPLALKRPLLGSFLGTALSV